MSNTNQVDISRYIEDKNRKLYTELSKNIEIELHQISIYDGISLPHIWGLRIEKGIAKIYYYKDIEHSGYFTHELLHLELISKGFLDYSDLVNDNINELLQPLSINILNSLAHQKIVTRFLELGYPIEQFNHDYLDFIDETTKNNFASIEFDKTNVVGYQISFNWFIKAFYCLKSNYHPKYYKSKVELEEFLIQQNWELYHLLEKSWLQFSKQNEIENMNHEVKLFFKELNNWIIRNNVEAAN